MKASEKHQNRFRRHKRIKAKLRGTSDRPRLCVFRSAKHIYAQLIDDEKGKTVAAASDAELKLKGKKEKESAAVKNEKSEPKKMARKALLAYNVGKLIAQKAQEKKIEKIVFDRGGYKYHGRVRALADGAKDGGLKF